MAFAEITLGLYKQGCDIYEAMSIAEEEGGNVLVGLEAYCIQLEMAKNHVKKISEVIQSYPKEMQDMVEIDGENHFIGISAPEPIILELIEKELAYIPDEWGDEEDDIDGEGEEDENEDEDSGEYGNIYEDWGVVNEEWRESLEEEED